MGQSLCKNLMGHSVRTLHPVTKMRRNWLLYDHGIRGSAASIFRDSGGAPELFPLFAAMEGKFTIMVHLAICCHRNRIPAAHSDCRDQKRFPRLQIIAASWIPPLAYVLEAMQGLEIFLDTSSCLFTIPENLLQQIYRTLPKHLFLFGSDYPLFDASAEMARLQYRLHLSDRELETILTNANNLGLC